MAKLAPATYEKPTTAEKPNPYVEGVKQYTDKGVDTAFQVTFDPGEYKSDKLLIQKAVNTHGFSAREVQTTYKDDDTVKVTSTFLVRPLRKRKGDTHESEVADSGESAKVASEATGQK
jgi:hypothetical protein